MTTINFKNEADKWNYLPVWSEWKLIKKVTYAHEVGTSGNNHWQCFIELKDGRTWKDVASMVWKLWKVRIHVSTTSKRGHPIIGRNYIGSDSKGGRVVGEKVTWNKGEPDNLCSKEKILAKSRLLYWDNVCNQSKNPVNQRRALMEFLKNDIEISKVKMGM